MQRVSVVGTSGSGKSGLARRIAAVIDGPCIELDGIQHLPGWQPIDPEEFLQRVEGVASGATWVIDGNYRAVVADGPVWARADTVVWLDLPRSTVMRQVIRRTLRRAVRREQLWNGNREPLTNFLVWRDDSVIGWAWTHHRTYHDRYERTMGSAALDHLTFVRLRSHAEADRWLATMTPPGPDGA